MISIESSQAVESGIQAGLRKEGVEPLQRFEESIGEILIGEVSMKFPCMGSAAIRRY